MRELINACFDALVPVVQKYEGTIDKFIGDEIMALFGAPIAHEDDAERALRVALEMMSAIAASMDEIPRKAREAWKQRHDFAFRSGRPECETPSSRR